MTTAVWPAFGTRTDLVCVSPAVDADWWFADNSDPRLAEAIKGCRRCPVTRECLQFAVDAGIQYGVYGGMTPQERTWVRKQQRNGRTGQPSTVEHGVTG